ncbi:sugar phosphate nucleotidyltransferase [Halorubrum sp. AD140]|uniref:sugar phosphate nucleotidyltransferase n=1 Tax=Halorubrum sp. AD140 TaxID=3050073 RepID=UPI002ACD156A|nr:sugar phosphate nucleotidyltransferase [Halorubrum sp. AD140]MDZ5810487.1 sugar phosphate nucleotidyltransferase [Halorubrum sp. AD140]
MQAVVPAAGVGIRLRPLTEKRTKGLVEVAGRLLLSYGFDRLVGTDVNRSVIVVGYREE